MFGENISALFEFIVEKIDFIEYYGILLAERLLTKSSVSYDLEKDLLKYFFVILLHFINFSSLLI